MKKKEYMISVSCCWVEPVKADSLEEAIEKTKQRYMYGSGRFPRDYVEVEAYNYGYQIED